MESASISCPNNGSGVGQVSALARNLPIHTQPAKISHPHRRVALRLPALRCNLPHSHATRTGFAAASAGELAIPRQFGKTSIRALCLRSCSTREKSNPFSARTIRHRQHDDTPPIFPLDSLRAMGSPAAVRPATCPRCTRRGAECAFRSAQHRESARARFWLSLDRE